MPAHHADDPLVLVPLRLPKSLVDAARAEAEAAGCTLSDAVRSRISSSAVQPLGKPRPARRVPPPQGATQVLRDPALVRQIAAIGGNLNQLARAVNSASVAGTPLQAVAVLARLCVIERQLDALGSRREDEVR
ncbi:MAG: plasmid mobilization relaxosome protein MobC [Burkholderiaceae bacterium]|nr:plasmid mobilization relaxosome protein MobC [Burkholderiaceae bacterium]